MGILEWDIQHYLKSDKMDPAHPPSKLPPINTANVHTEQPQSTHLSPEHGKRRRSSVRPSTSNEDDIHKVRFVNFEPKHMTCPKCHHNITTQLTYEVGDSAWSWCCCCVIIGCFLGCCFLPFYMDRFKDVVHNCPRCHHEIAKYSRNDPTNHRKIWSYNDRWLCTSDDFM